MEEKGNAIQNLRAGQDQGQDKDIIKRNVQILTKLDMNKEININKNIIKDQIKGQDQDQDLNQVKRITLVIILQTFNVH